MKQFFVFVIGLLFTTLLVAQEQPITKPAGGYRFQYRIKGPDHDKSRVLELMVDEHGNYLVATFRGEKSSFVYLIVYNLYSWDEKYKVKLDDNRCELYNSMFDESGEYMFVNYDIYRNLFKKINLKTGEIEKVDCSTTPKGCRKIEPQFYKLDAYTIGDNYYIYRDDKLENYIRIMVRKEMYIPKEGEEGSGADYTPLTGGVIQLTPAEIRELKAGVDVFFKGINLFYDPNSLDANGKEIPYEPAEGEPYKIRLTPAQLAKLEKKISFTYEKFVIKLDLDALEAEMNNQ